MTRATTDELDPSRFRPRRPAAWICGAILLKLALLFFFVAHLNPEFPGEFRLHRMAGDAFDYVDTVENLLAGRGYVLGEDNYAARMPGYAAVYLPLRLVFERELSLDLVLVLQALLSGLSVYLLAVVSVRLLGERRLFPLVFVLYGLATYVSVWDASILTESFAVSSLIFALHFLERARSRGRRSSWVLAGVFLTWTGFLRPFLFPFFLLFLAAAFLRPRRSSVRATAAGCLLLLLPLVVADVPWIIRNYRVMGRFVPTQGSRTKGYELSPGQSAWRGFMKAWGGDPIPWNPDGEAAWFTTDEFLEGLGFVRPPDSVFPAELFDGGLEREQLRQARALAWEAEDPMTDEVTRREKDLEAARIYEAFTRHIEEKHAFLYHVGSRLRSLRIFLLQPYSYYLPYSWAEAGPPGKIFKLFHLALNNLVVLGGLLGLPFLLLAGRRCRAGVLLFACLALWVILYFPIVRYPEARFLTTAYPFLLVSFSFSLSRLLPRR